MLPTVLSPTQQNLLLHRGIALFNAAQFFAAHEAWEQLWHSLPPGQPRQTVQLLIQFAVTLELYRRSIPAGVLRMHSTYLPRVAALPPIALGLNLQSLSAAMEDALASLLATHPTPPRGIISLDLIRAPQIIPVYNDPFTSPAQ